MSDIRLDVRRTQLEERLAMIEYAVSRLKEAGFVHVYSSMKSEACYYALKDRTGVIRVAAHRYSTKTDKAITNPVLSCLTFGENCNPNTEDALDSLIEQAVGRYVMGDKKGCARWRKNLVRRKISAFPPPQPPPSPAQD